MSIIHHRLRYFFYDITYYAMPASFAMITLPLATASEITVPLKPLSGSIFDISYFLDAIDISYFQATNLSFCFIHAPLIIREISALLILYTIDRQRFGQWPRNTLCIKSNFADSDY
jgi:hypothetical protein